MAPRQSKQWEMFWRLGQAYRHLVCFPDGQIGWKRSAVARGLDLARTFQPDVVLSSSLPNTSHLVGRAIARQMRLPWVAELRDLWTENHNFRRVQPLRALEERLERSVLGEADALVTVSEVWAERLYAKYRRPTFVVPNGYDPTDYPATARPRDSAFTIVYTGMFYDGKQNILPLFEAVARLAATGRIDPHRFRLRFFGHYLGPIAARAEAFGIAPFCEVSPSVPYRDALVLQSEATVLLFLDWADGAIKGWYSAKIYEYLGAGRPILSIGPRDSVVAQLLERTGAGQVARTSQEIESLLLRWLEHFDRCGTVPYTTDEVMRRQFQRQEAAKTMASVLDHVVSGVPAALYA
jgi:glycosyltransferase involved in cell wall biosynthesis